MNKLTVVAAAFSLLAAVSCKKEIPEAAPVETVKEVVPTQNILTRNVGKYPTDIKLFEDKDLTDRLKKLMGADYDEMVKNFNVVSPVKAENEVYRANGCMQHNCPGYYAFIYFDAKNDNLNVLIDRDGKVKEYAEKGKIEISEELKTR